MIESKEEELYLQELADSYYTRMCAPIILTEEDQIKIMKLLEEEDVC